MPRRPGGQVIDDPRDPDVQGFALHGQFHIAQSPGRLVPGQVGLGGERTQRRQRATRQCRRCAKIPQGEGNRQHPLPRAVHEMHPATSLNDQPGVFNFCGFNIQKQVPRRAVQAGVHPGIRGNRRLVRINPTGQFRQQHPQGMREGSHRREDQVDAFAAVDPGDFPAEGTAQTPFCGLQFDVPQRHGSEATWLSQAGVAVDRADIRQLRPGQRRQGRHPGHVEIQSQVNIPPFQQVPGAAVDPHAVCFGAHPAVRGQRGGLLG